MNQNIVAWYWLGQAYLGQHVTGVEQTDTGRLVCSAIVNIDKKQD